jgi:hypothetical protein
MTRTRMIKVAVPIAVVILAARAGRAEVTYGSDASRTESGKSRVTFDATVDDGADRYLLVAVTTAEAATPVIAASFGGVALTFAGAISSSAGHCRVEWWGLAAPAPGTQPVLVDVGGNPNQLAANALAYRGVDPRQPTGPFVGSNGTGPTAVTVRDTGAGGKVLDAVCAWSADSTIAIAGRQQTARWHWSTGSLSAAGSEHPGGPAVTMTWTAGGSGNMEWAAAGLGLLAADAATASPAGPVRLAVETAGCAIAGRSRAARPPGLGMLALVVAGLWARRRRSRAREPNRAHCVEPRG